MRNLELQTEWSNEPANRLVWLEEQHCVVLWNEFVFNRAVSDDAFTITNDLYCQTVVFDEML